MDRTFQNENICLQRDSNSRQAASRQVNQRLRPRHLDDDMWFTLRGLWATDKQNHNATTRVILIMGTCVFELTVRKKTYIS